MKLSDFLKTWDGVQDENRFSRKIMVVLTACLLVSLIMLFNKTERIILQPITLTENGWLEVDEASISYKESWGTYLAILLGNVTPATLDFIRERIEPLLSSGIYNSVVTAMERQAADIRENRASFRYELRSVKYEIATQKTFAHGYSYEVGAAGDEKRFEKTFEFKMRVRNYLPEITYMTTYNGPPRTEKILQKVEAQEERQDRVESERGN